MNNLKEGSKILFPLNYQLLDTMCGAFEQSGLDPSESVGQRTNSPHAKRYSKEQPAAGEQPLQAIHFAPEMKIRTSSLNEYKIKINEIW